LLLKRWISYNRSIEDWIEENVGYGKVVSRSMVSSSSWSSAYVYTTEGGKKLFVKQSSNGADGMFKGEALGLQAMYGTAQMHGPQGSLLVTITVYLCLF
jgi:protein-ribulosamine 3-kinase